MTRSKTPADVTDLASRRRSRPRPAPAGPSPATGEGPVWDSTLRVLVFATEQAGHPETSAPFVIIPEAAAAFLPRHPGGLEWRYFATMRLDDQLLAGDRAAITAALRQPGFYISHRPLHSQ